VVLVGREREINKEIHEWIFECLQQLDFISFEVILLSDGGGGGRHKCEMSVQNIHS
jgi:hypothetical protein